MSKWLLVGLGNPGPEYAGTRHNVGFGVVDELAARWDISLGRRRFRGRFGSGLVAGREVVMIEPMTFMNLSGRAVGPARAFFSIPLEQLVVVHDDIDLSRGRLRVKSGGGTGGHRGLRSISQCLGSSGYLRLRLGVGRPGGDGDVTGYVLGRFSKEEQVLQREMVERGADAVEEILCNGPRSAMNRFNAAPISEDGGGSHGAAAAGESE